VRVLLVDDEPGVRLLVGKHLARQGWRVDKVLDGDEALSASANVSYDAVVLDHRMPGRTGLEVAAELGPSPPVVLFTAHVDHATEDAAARVGCALVEKGDLDALVAAIEGVARGS
jgi:DNA-binding response OmpR family regulator